MIVPLSRAMSGRRTAMAFGQLARRTAATQQMRGFIAPTVARRADFVQELYLKELKAYKTPPVKESDSQGHVSTFKVPSSPKSPEEADLAGSLKEYEGMAVEVEGHETAAEGGKAGGAGSAAVEDWLVEDEENDPAAAPAHGTGH